ncbi:NPCBM/NEW2 domain-containing protein [Actinosynnema sp. NPDC059335]|uniref:NPCBM/NEW2 domain-containing protein n=1 Tax=Actinosynnema sp. NPDC059335 TaxID=3346804 RepID=UPI003671268F
MVEEPSGSRGGLGDKVLKWIAIVADVAAVAAVLTGSTAAVIGISGAVAVLAGLLYLGTLAGSLPRFRVAVAIVGIIAGTAALAVVVDRGLARDGRGVATGTPAPTAPTSADGDRSGTSASAGATSTGGGGPTSTTGVPVGTASKPLSEVALVGRESSYYDLGSLKVNGAEHDKVMIGESYLCDPYVETYQVDRKYRTFSAKVGLGDKSPSEATVTFAVMVDDETRASATLGVGRVEEIRADITGAFRIRISIESSACYTTVYSGWIDPVLTP